MQLQFLPMQVQASSSCVCTFTTMALPVASAGATFHVIMSAGKFHLSFPKLSCFGMQIYDFLLHPNTKGDFRYSDAC